MHDNAAPGGSAPVPPDRIDQLLSQMADLHRINTTVMQELGQLRRENTELRRQLEALRGLQRHEPYAALGGTPSLSAHRPSSPTGPRINVQDMESDSPAKVMDPEPKRLRPGGPSPNDV